MDKFLKKVYYLRRVVLLNVSGSSYNRSNERKTMKATITEDFIKSVLGFSVEQLTWYKEHPSPYTESQLNYYQGRVDAFSLIESMLEA